MIYTNLLVCPVCSTQLTQAGAILQCINAHTFDIAREGYINLLLKKLSGDTKEMLRARRDFLERGYYRPLSDAINELVSTHLHSHEISSPVAILDAGCGEGYYSGRLQSYLAQQDYRGQYVGVDISKDAVKMAAKKYQEACFVVANLNERLTFADHTFNVLLNIFAPRNTDEFARVIAPHGLLVVAIPSPEHLAQLRSVLHLLSIEENKQQRVIEQFTGQFALVTTASIAYTLPLSKQEMALVAMMTPNYWHMSDDVEKMVGIEEIQTEVGFTCLVFRKE